MKNNVIQLQREFTPEEQAALLQLNYGVRDALLQCSGPVLKVHVQVQLSNRTQTQDLEMNYVAKREAQSASQFHDQATQLGLQTYHQIATQVAAWEAPVTVDVVVNNVVVA